MKAHLINAIMENGHKIGVGQPGFLGGSSFSAYGNPAVQFAVKKYLESLVATAQDDDILASYLIFMAPAVDMSGNVHMTLMEDRFLDRFTQDMVSKGAPPSRAAPLFTEGERQMYDSLVRLGRQPSSNYIYASLR